jgi:hypothetical protein
MPSDKQAHSDDGQPSVEFSGPYAGGPLVITVAEHIRCLRRILDPTDSLYCPGQKLNIEVLIGMYERGENKAKPLA